MLDRNGGLRREPVHRALVAHDRQDGLVFGYAALPCEPAEYPLLSAHGSIKAGPIENGSRELTVQVENFGLAESVATTVRLRLLPEGREPATFTASLPPLAPYAAADLSFSVPADLVPAGAAPKAEIHIESDPANDVLKASLPTLP